MLWIVTDEQGPAERLLGVVFGLWHGSWYLLKHGSEGFLVILSRSSVEYMGSEEVLAISSRAVDNLNQRALAGGHCQLSSSSSDRYLARIR